MLKPHQVMAATSALLSAFFSATAASAPRKAVFILSAAQEIRESRKTRSLEMVDRIRWHMPAQFPQPNAALAPPLLFANRNQFVRVIDGAG
jgi:hypothetical protein